ncbi:MAG TPA: HAMP domain-containing sensor histidine kinase [Acidimicrobiia bacterium]|nr:HAMP domain-containing sensor histidine kinase [Acidimicrobiia bacterium]
MTRALLFAAPAVLGLAAVELVMQPTASDRLEVALFFAISAGIVAGAAGWWSRWSRRIGHLGRAVLALAVASVLAVGAAVTAASGMMFIEAHDLQLLWIVLGFALILGIVFAATVSGPLTADLERIADTARRVGMGHLDARTEVRRRDEVGLVASALDEMATRLAELEADRRREQASREAFLTAIGHDLRTPLSALRAAVEALDDGVAVDRGRYLRSMREDIRALGGLVEDLFLLARIESGAFEPVTEPVDLSDLADEAIEALRPVARRRGVELQLRTPGHVQALGSTDTLSRVIRNLVDNAIRHSPPQGVVVVSVALNGSAVVEVVDEGVGFRPEFVPRAFESFSRDDQARARDGGGAGLGLAIARAFVEVHGGDIWAEPGPGGRVSFRVPTTAGLGGRLAG